MTICLEHRILMQFCVKNGKNYLKSRGILILQYKNMLVEDEKWVLAQ